MRAMKPFLICAALVVASQVAGAQGVLSTAKGAAQKAANATNAHIEAEQHPEAATKPAAKVADVKPADSKASNAKVADPKASNAKVADPKATPVKPADPKAAASKPADPKATASKPVSPKAGAAKPGNPKSAATAQDASKDAAPNPPTPPVDSIKAPAVIFREAFAYEADGRRDPFNSLLKTNELRPAMSDLRLTGILFDHSGSHSVATLRDIGTNAQYRVTVGSALGRMRVSNIRYTTVVFTIDEFGMTRQDSLMLRDSTKARGK